MSRSARGAGPVLVALLLLAGAIGPAVAGVATAAQQTNETTPTNETTDETTDDLAAVTTGPYDRSTLRSAGRQPPNAPPSVRALGSSTTLWLEHAPTGFMREDTPEQREHVEPGDTIRRDTVYFRSSRPWDAPDREVELVVVYWEDGQVEQTTSDGQVVSERAAVNQTVDRYNVTLSSGYDVHEIDLRAQYDEPVQVAMFLEGREGETQWAFNQVSSAAGQTVAISDRGDAVTWSFIWLFLPFALVLLAVLYVDQKVLETAGAGPQYRTTEYVGLAFFVGFFTLLFAYEWVIDVLARAPWALGICAGLGVGLIVIELFGDSTYKDLFLRFDVEDVEAREDGAGIQKVEAVEKKLVELDGGKPGVVEDGIKPFIARARGAVPVLDTGPLRRETQLDVEGPWRELHLIDPSADQALEYEPPEWSLDVIAFDRESEREDLVGAAVELVPRVDALPVLVGLGVWYAAYALSLAYTGTGLFGLFGGGAVVLGWWASPHGGRAIADLAPMHFDAVITNVLTMAEGLEEVADRDYYRRKFHSEQGRNLAQRRAESEDSEQSRMQAIMDRLAPPEGDVDGGASRAPDAPDQSADAGVTADDD